MARFVHHRVPGAASFSKLVSDGSNIVHWLAKSARTLPKVLALGIASLWIEGNFKMMPTIQHWCRPADAFMALFLFRYLRFIVHIVAFMFYRPTPTPDPKEDTLYHPADVTVVMATVEPEGADFELTIHSILAAGCARFIVVTIEERFEETRLLCESISSHIHVFSSCIANKRVQLCIGLAHVQTSIVLFADDHIWFSEPGTFLRSVLAPFQDPDVGGVAVGKRVKRVHGRRRFSIADILNFLACLYLERHNFGKYSLPIV
jgi:hypothetical protein